MPGGDGDETTVSVVLPTYHRPDMLAEAARSVLTQRLPAGTSLELIIAVSDAEAPADRAAADRIAAEDSRVRVVVAERRGPGVARNTGLAVARGDVLVLIDDDCEAQRGWLEAGLARLEEVELVQGKTVPIRPVTRPYERSIWVEQLSGLWESCNLFFRRSVYDKYGGFDEDWNPTGRPGQHWGEDTEWGWRVVRGGTTAAFEQAALVYHAVFDQSFREWLRYETKVRYFPMMVQDIPELRDSYLYKRYFLTRRHVTLTAGVGLLGIAGVAALSGHPKTARGAAMLAGVPLASAHARQVYYTGQKEWVRYLAMAYGTLKYRRVVL